ncbi:MAG: ABC transporter permease [Actinomycetota bacterium]
MGVRKDLSTEREWNNAPSGQTSSAIVSTIPTRGYGALLAVATSPDEVDRIARDIRGLGAATAVAKDQIDDQKRAFRIIGFALGGIGAIALLVAAVGVVNTMVMSILERTREIGVMRAVGASRKAVRRLFTLEAVLLGLFGGVVGVVVAYGISALANPVVNQQLSDNGLTNRSIISVPPLLGIAVIVITTIIGILAGLYPVARAARMDPVAALRAE